MKQKKQIKVIISLLVMIAVLFGGWGLLKVNRLKAEEASIVKNNKIEQLITKLPDSDSDDFEPLVNYPGYIAFGTSNAFIPNEFSFFPKWTDESKAIPRKGIITDDDSLKPDMHEGIIDTSDNNTDKTAIIDYLNIGKYKGKNIAIRMIVKFENWEPLVLIGGSGKNTTVGLSSYGALNVYKGGLSKIKQIGDITVTYQFLDANTVDEEIMNPAEEKSIELAGYYSTTMSNTKDLSFKKNVVGTIYGVPRGDGTDKYPNSNLQYKIDGDNIIFRALGHGSDWKDENKFNKNGKYTRLGATFVFTFTGLEELQYICISDNADIGFGWSSNSYVPLGIDSPTSEPTVISSVDASNSAKLPFAFNQVIPPEMNQVEKDNFPNPSKPTDPIVKEWTVDNQIQSFTWKFENQLPSSSLSMVPAGTTGFEVNDEATTDKFTYSSSSIVPKTNPPKENSFYNQFYTFQRYMKMDYENKLTLEEAKNLSSPPETTSNYYMKATSEIDLVTSIDGVDLNSDKSGGSTTTATWINFASNVTYDYVYKNSAGDLVPIPDPDNKLITKGGSLLTWQVPLSPVTLATSPNSSQLATLYALNASTNEEKAEADNNKAPEIAGYTFVQAKLNDSTTDYQLKYTDGNIVTLEYDKIPDYEVKIQVEDEDNNLLNSDARNKFEIKQNGNPVTSSELELDKEYTIGQTAIAKAGYLPAEGEITFEIGMDGTGKFIIKKPTPSTNNPYSFAINPDTGELTITVVNLPGSYSLVRADDLTFGNHKLPNPTLPVEIFPTNDWSLTYINNDPTADKLQIKVTATPFKNETSELDGLLYFKKEDTDEPISINAAEQTLYNYAELKELSPNEEIKKTSDGAGFFLKGENIHNAYKTGKIPAGNTDYTAEITFIIANDAE